MGRVTFFHIKTYQPAFQDGFVKQWVWRDDSPKKVFFIQIGQLFPKIHINLFKSIRHLPSKLP